MAMRKIVFMMSVSLDGFMAGPDGELDWHMVDDELMAAFWPTADEDPASTAPMVEFARIWRDMPKIVFSRTLERAGWNTTVVPEVVPDQIRKLQAEPGGDLALGGANLAATFLRHDLIDEYRLYVHPIVLGRGQPMFQAPDTRVDLRPARDPPLRQRRRPPPLWA